MYCAPRGLFSRKPVALEIMTILLGSLEIVDATLPKMGADLTSLSYFDDNQKCSWKHLKYFGCYPQQEKMLSIPWLLTLWQRFNESSPPQVSSRLSTWILHKSFVTHLLHLLNLDFT